MPQRIHLIAFNVPWPANYGGVIDVYYKVKALHDLGVEVVLHCWQYDAPPAPELEKVSYKVYYYPRQTGLRANLSLLPYNVYSRRAPELLGRLLDDPAPILYDGIHTTYLLGHPQLRGRRQIVRMHNVEHSYYLAIARQERRLWRRAFHYLEALRLRLYEPKLRQADAIVAVSSTDAEHFAQRYSSVPTHYIPCFHGWGEVASHTEPSDYILYHAKLSVAENHRAALYLVHQVLRHLPYRSVIAGLDPQPELIHAVALYPHITIIANPPSEDMQRLIDGAQIHLLYTAQATGLKLKLLGSLYSGRHVVANSTMVEGSGLERLCHIGDTPERLITLCRELMLRTITPQELETRRTTLSPYAIAPMASELSAILFD